MKIWQYRFCWFWRQHVTIWKREIISGMVSLPRFFIMCQNSLHESCSSITLVGNFKWNRLRLARQIAWSIDCLSRIANNKRALLKHISIDDLDVCQVDGLGRRPWYFRPDCRRSRVIKRTHAHGDAAPCTPVTKLWVLSVYAELSLNKLIIFKFSRWLITTDLPSSICDFLIL